MFYFNAVFPFGRQSPQVLENRKYENFRSSPNRKKIKGELTRCNKAKCKDPNRSSNLLQYNHAAQCSTVLLLVQDPKAI